MPTYVFKGRNRLNEVVVGERVADNREALRQILRREQVTLTSVKEKGREIGIAGEEVEARGAGSRLLRRKAARGGRLGHVGAPARPRHEIALGQQLGVGVHDEPPRDAEVRGQRARGGQAGSRGQPT